MGRKLTDVSSAYGAPMGRPSRGLDFLDANKTTEKVRLRRLGITSGGYDSGGAYWGSGQPLYLATFEGEDFFFRAADRKKAKALTLEKWPDARFYR